MRAALSSEVSEMGVTTYLYSGTYPGDTGTSGVYFSNLRVSKDTGYNTGYPWLSDSSRKFAFFAVCPYDASLTLSGASFDYTVPAPTSQVDLMGASAVDVPVGRGADVPLAFGHLLSALEFNVKGDFFSGTVKSITLKGVPSQGTYNLKDKAWSGQKAPADYSLPVSLTYTAGVETAVNIGDPLLILPGKMPEGASVELVISDSGGNDYSYSVSISGFEFPEGRKTTLNLSPEGITLGVKILPWDRVLQLVGFIKKESIQVINPPEWEIVLGSDTITTLDREVHIKGLDSSATLVFRFLRPIGADWRATITNALDFSFPEGEDISGGITTVGKVIKIKVLPRLPQGVSERKTELYITVYGTEADPDNSSSPGNGPVGIGRGLRYTIIQDPL